MTMLAGRVNVYSGPASPALPRQRDGSRPITLRVRDVAASQRFYADLFGFVPADRTGYSDAQVTLISPLLANGYRSILLTRRPAPDYASGFMLELETTAEVLDRYMLARLLHAPASPLIRRGRLLSTSVQDLDGHRIELRSQISAESRGQSSHASRWDRHQDEDYQQGPRDESEPTPDAFRREHD